MVALLRLFVQVCCAVICLFNVCLSLPPGTLIFPDKLPFEYDYNPTPRSNTRRPRYKSGEKDSYVIGQPPSLSGSSNQTFLTKVDNYPTDIIVSSVRRNFPTLRSYFNLSPPTLDINTNTRQQPDEDDFIEERVCGVKDTIIYPVVAKDVNGKEKYIVNDGRKLKQPVKVEQCLDENNVCSTISPHMPAAFSTRCVQKFASRVMVAFDENSLNAYTDEFRFPSACVCLIKKFSTSYRNFRVDDRRM